VVGIVSGLAFLAVAAWTLLGDGDDGADEQAADGRRLAGIALVLTVAAAFVASELGDKTMLATFALAARQDPIATWVGATAGMVVANLVAVVVGRGIGTRLRPRVIRIGSSALFALAGIVVIAGALGIG
jgi:putative Ca2+/H+ antiporter (TMEM165/GDT1 family)